MRYLKTNVTVHKDGQSATIPEGTTEDEIEDAGISDLITNPDVWGEEDDEDPNDLGPVPPTGVFGRFGDFEPPEANPLWDGTEKDANNGSGTPQAEPEDGWLSLSKDALLDEANNRRNLGIPKSATKDEIADALLEDDIERAE